MRHIRSIRTATAAIFVVALVSVDLDFGVSAADSLEQPAAAAAVASGADYDADGFDDLVVGMPGESVGGAAHTGAVQVFYGSPSGLSLADDTVIWQGTPGLPTRAETNDLFGSTLASGDFDGDGFDDLAVGVPGEDLLGVVDAGQVVVIPGAITGLDPSRAQALRQRGTAFADDLPVGGDQEPEVDDRFGSALTAADFDGDGRDDLAIGAPGKDIGARRDAGSVQLVLGGGALMAGSKARIFTKVGAPVRTGDRYGASLAVGDITEFGAVDRVDLVVGVPGHDFAQGGVTFPDSGGVQVLPGTELGLVIYEPTPGDKEHAPVGAVRGCTFHSDHQGDAIVVGDLVVGGRAHDGADEVALSARAGATSYVCVLFADSPIVVDVGTPVAALERRSIGGGGFQLIAGAPGEDVARHGSTIVDAGAVREVSTQAIATRQVIQGALASGGGPEPTDEFGRTLTAGDFNGDGVADLAIGAPGEDLAVDDCGAVTVYLRNTAGTANASGRLLHPDAVGVSGRCGKGDRFGAAL